MRAGLFPRRTEAVRHRPRQVRQPCGSPSPKDAVQRRLSGCRIGTRGGHSYPAPPPRPTPWVPAPTATWTCVPRPQSRGTRPPGPGTPLCRRTCAGVRYYRARAPASSTAGRHRGSTRRGTRATSPRRGRPRPDLPRRPRAFVRTREQAGLRHTPQGRMRYRPPSGEMSAAPEPTSRSRRSSRPVRRSRGRARPSQCRRESGALEFPSAPQCPTVSPPRCDERSEQRTGSDKNMRPRHRNALQKKLRSIPNSTKKRCSGSARDSVKRPRVVGRYHVPRPLAIRESTECGGVDYFIGRMPRLTANRTRSTWVVTPSLRTSAARWLSTVRGLIDKRVAVTELVIPSRIRRRESEHDGMAVPTAVARSGDWV